MISRKMLAVCLVLSALAALCSLIGIAVDAGDATGFPPSLYIGLAAAAFSAMLISTLLIHRFARRLAAATEFANRLALGAVDIAPPDGDVGEVGALIGALRTLQDRLGDLTQREASHRHSAQGRLVEALESSTEAMVLLDPEQHIVIANSRVADVLGPMAAIRIQDGLAFADLFRAEQAEWAVKLQTPGEVKLPTGVWLSIAREEAVDGGMFLIWTDITLRKSYERKLETVAYEDPLTRVRNRAFLVEQLDRDGETRGAVTGSAMLVVNIDRFRQINHTHGSRIGDGVLGAVAARLSAMLQESEICARTGGDEFVIWLPACKPDRCEHLAEAVETAFAAPIATAGRTLSVHLSAGLACAALERATGHDLLRDARAALEQAKRTGGNRIEFFTEALRQETKSRMRIEADLPDAIRERQLYLDYQPLIDLATGRIGGFEALVRWRHPVLGQIQPGRFIPIAEDSGAIVELGWLVLSEAAAQASQWFADGLLDEGAKVAVNLSPRQIADPRNAEDLIDYLDRNPTAARLLKFELTESVLLQDPVAMIDLLTAFKRRGVGLSLDDFGTGYSSLSYLHKFPFDVLKIDRSFVTDIPHNADALRLVRTIIELGRDLGLSLVAEGVETEAQAECLKTLGCDVAQGYFYSRPIAPRAATALLRAQIAANPASARWPARAS